MKSFLFGTIVSLRATNKGDGMSLSGLADIPVFIGHEQPETCGRCGARTSFIVLTGKLQVHECLNCEFVWFLEFDDYEDEAPDW